MRGQPLRTSHAFHPAGGTPAVVWETSDGLTDYPAAVAKMESLASAIRAGAAPETVWLVEHPALYTAGTSARDGDLLDPDRLPVYRTGRGGELTYHGPGQRVAYVMLDLQRRRADLRAYVGALEAWVIDALAAFGIAGEVREGRVGVWVERPDLAALPDGTMREDKVAAIGVRVRRWVTFHGVAINLAPDLGHYAGIVPCGVRGHGVTSLHALGCPVSREAFDAALRRSFERVFGPAEEARSGDAGLDRAGRRLPDPAVTA